MTAALDPEYLRLMWRSWADNTAERLKRPVVVTDNGFTANVIEGEWEADRDAGDEDDR